jgi:hypothetical protein
MYENTKQMPSTSLVSCHATIRSSPSHVTNHWEYNTAQRVAYVSQLQLAIKLHIAYLHINPYVSCIYKRLNKLTNSIRLRFEKLTVDTLVKKSPPFMQSKGSFTCYENSQEASDLDGFCG